MLFSGMIDAIGHTPLVRLCVPSAPEVEVYAKLELQNPFGMKDRVAKKVILEAKRTGVLTDGAHIVESSSGTMALGVALVGTSLGHPVHIVTDPRVDEITLAKLRSLGVDVDIVPKMSKHGWQSARLERLDELLAQLPGAFWPQQYSNPDNPLAYRDLAEEVVEDLGTVDVLVGSVGSGGSLCGTSRALRRLLPDLRVVGVDCTGSALFDQPDRPHRLQSGLGNSMLPANLDRTLIDEIHWLNDHEAYAAARDLARDQKIFGGNTSGSVYRILRHTAERSAPGTRVVGILPDRGDRYAGTVYSDEYWAAKSVTALPNRATAVEVDYGTEVDAWSYARPRPAGQPGRTLLFVESNTTGSGMAALTTAARLGFLPVLLTNDPDRYHGLAAAGARVVTCDTNSMAALRRFLPDNFRREDLAGVTTTSEFYAGTVAALADRWTLPGNTAQAIDNCRDKSRTRAVLAAAGVRQPAFATVRDVADVPAAVREVGLPCVVKPADGSGSHNVLLCDSPSDVSAHVERILAVTTNVRGQATSGTALVESLLPGREYSVETCHWQGQVYCLGVTEKHLAEPPHFVESRHVFPAELPTTVERDLVDVVRAALDATGFRFGPCHTEVRLTPAGPAVVEINPRAAGGMIPELIRIATGTDLVEQQILLAAGRTPDLHVSADGCAGIQFLLAPRAGTVAAVTGVDQAMALPGVERVHTTVAPGDTVRPARSSYDRLGYVIVRGTSHAEVHSTLDKVAELVTVELEDR